MTGKYMRYISSIISLAFLCGALSITTGCKSVKPFKARTFKERIESSREEGARRDDAFRRMPAANLLHELERESLMGVEPFNSRAYREAVRRGADIGRQLRDSIDAFDRSELLTLLALRKADAVQYATIDPARRVQILVDSLKNGIFYNVWGIPHLYWEDAARALIAEGQRAVPALEALFDDKREAPVWGDEEVMVSRAYRYRVRDYAWALIREIQGAPIADMPRDPERRDRLINRMNQ